MNEWITDRPPKRAEVDGGVFCWVTLKNNTTDLYSGASARHFWSKQSDCCVIAWKPMEYPEPYQPPKPKWKREEFWLGYSHRDDGDGKNLRRFYDCGIYRSEPTAVESVHVREVVPSDPTPEAVELVAATLEAACEDAYDTNALAISCKVSWLRELAEVLRGKK